MKINLDLVDKKIKKILDLLPQENKNNNFNRVKDLDLKDEINKDMDIELFKGKKIKKNSDLTFSIEKLEVENIQKSRILYEKIILLGDILNESVNKNKFCEKKAFKILQENTDLKNLIAELDVKYKLNPNKIS